MRLVRFPERPARVSEDVRAALASLGRGRHVVGGVGLVGLRPPGAPGAVDAVLVVPHGVVVVVGVDLPDPAMRLEAPLDGQWKADGWPLVSPDDAVHPAVEPLARARALAERIREREPDTALGTVVAVGPFVETVEQPPADLAGPVRVVHPTATSMLAAVVSLASAEQALSAQRARALIRELAPSADLDDDAFAAEGFGTEEHPLTDPAPTVPLDHPAAPAVKTTRTVPAPRPAPRPLPQPYPRAVPAVTPTAPTARRSWQERQPARRWRPYAAVGLLVAVAAATLTIATGGSGDSSAGPTAPPATSPTVVQVGGIPFTEHAEGAASDCAAHATGDAQARLAEGGCEGVRRGSYGAAVNGTRVAVSVAALTFADERQAAAFRELADTPGSGTITDLATETGRWPEPAPTFAGAAYVSSVSGVTVRIVLACGRDGQSRPDDPALADAAQAALGIPLSE